MASAKEDAKATGGFFTEIRPQSGKYYAVALVYGPIYQKGQIIGYDYHWYRQNPDGSWSHKPGHGPVTNLDASGNVIFDPNLANRRTEYADGVVVDYSEFVGYYYVGGGDFCGE